MEGDAIQPAGRLLRPVPLPPSDWGFPDLRDRPSASAVVGVGADLEPGTLAAAYRRGIFPWPHGRDLPWFCPEMRAVLSTASAHVSRSLQSALRASRWTSTVDLAFGEVIQGCARRREGTWIDEAIQSAYRNLHDLGWAHSLEVWDEDQLVGGIYGIAIGATFCAESMFHSVTNGSKVAVFDLLARWADAGGLHLDGQVPTAHLLSLGFQATPRSEFLEALVASRDDHVPMDTQRFNVARLA